MLHELHSSNIYYFFGLFHIIEVTDDSILLLLNVLGGFLCQREMKELKRKENRREKRKVENFHCRCASVSCC